jgi:ribosomal-protein-alanine N-acetyltransferase
VTPETSLEGPLHIPGADVSLPGFAFRAWSPDDIPDLVAAWRDPEMQRWLPEAPQPFEAGAAAAFVDDAAKQLAGGTGVAIAIADRSTGRAVGSVSFHVWGPRHWNVGYWIAPQYRSRGMATRSVTILSRWAFSEHPSLERLSLYHLPGNDASGRVAERAGFRREGLLRRWADVGGRQRDWVMYSLIRDDLAGDEGRTDG